MIKKATIFLLVMISVSAFAQDISNEVKFDSIIKEADLLYNYEKVTWNATDLANDNEKIKENIGRYIIYHSNDTIFAVFTDKNSENQIAEYSYKQNNLKIPFNTDFNKKPLAKKVLNLFQIKNKILKELNSNPSEYELNFQKGFNPNPVLISVNNEYRLYIIIGTANKNVIPFGNDYLFNADKNGQIKDWKRFHKTLIATQTKGNNNEVVISAIHSHLPMTPLITATDICTFRLYGVDLFGMKEFMVSSTALNKIFKYNSEDNSITEIEL